MEFKSIFKSIALYHKNLGYPKNGEEDIQQANKANEVILALFAELAELQESYPWKPWRPKNYKDINIDNMKEEIVDIFFFLGSFIEIFDISPEELEWAFNQKLRENYRRIENGYNEIES